MRFDPHLAQVHEQLVAAAALGDDRTREVAGALTTAAVPAVRLALIAAVCEIADEVTGALLDHPGSPTVAVRIDGDEAAVEIRAGAADAAPPPRRDDGDASARISLRLTDALKADIDTAAERDGVSVNTWLVRAAGDALRGGASGPAPAGPGRDQRHHNHHVTGWINS